MIALACTWLGEGLPEGINKKVAWAEVVSEDYKVKMTISSN